LQNITGFPEYKPRTFQKFANNNIFIAVNAQPREQQYDNKLVYGDINYYIQPLIAI
jgi:hypothetical protein